MTDLEMDSWEVENEDSWDDIPSGTPSPEPSTPRKRKREEDGTFGLYESMLAAEERQKQNEERQKQDEKRQKQEEIDKQLALSFWSDSKFPGWRKRAQIQYNTAAKAKKREEEEHSLPSLADLRKDSSLTKKLTTFAKIFADNTTFSYSTALQIYFQNILGVMFSHFGGQEASLELIHTVVAFIEEF